MYNPLHLKNYVWNDQDANNVDYKCLLLQTECVIILPSCFLSYWKKVAHFV